MPLETFDIANGIVLIAFCGLSIYVGIIIILNYFKYKRREFLFVGLTWIFLVSPWYAAGISFVMFLLTGKGLTPEAYFIIGNVFVPVALVCWLIAFTDLTYKKNQKLIVSIYIIHGTLYLIVFFYFLYTDHSLIGQLKGYTDVQYGPLVISYYLFADATALITGIIFARKAISSENPELQLKGKLILAALISFVVGSALDAALPHIFLTFPIYRTLEILSAILFYWGFILPNWIKKRLLKEEKIENSKS